MNPRTGHARGGDPEDHAPYPLANYVVDLVRVLLHFRPEDLSPDGDYTLEEALQDPESHFWSFKDLGLLYTCRDWAEVVDAATEVAQ